MFKQLFLLCFLNIAFAARKKPLNVVLAEILSSRRFAQRMPRVQATCTETSETLAAKLDSTVPIGLQYYRQVVDSVNHLKEKLEFCEESQRDNTYQNLRTAILSGLFSGKVPLIEVPFQLQAECLTTITNEEMLCANMKQYVCNLVNPLNPRGRAFGSQHIKDFSMKFSDVGQEVKDESICGAMSKILDSPGALRNAIEIPSKAKYPVRNGMSTVFLQDVDKASAAGIFELGDYDYDDYQDDLEKQRRRAKAKRKMRIRKRQRLQRRLAKRKHKKQ